MSLASVACPSCGGTLPRHARWITVVCPWCEQTVSNGDRGVKAASFLASRTLLELPADGLPRARLDEVPYRLLGRIARGEHGDVLWAERASRLTERVVLHVPRRDAAPAERAWVALVALQASRAPGAPHFTLRLPIPVARGTLRDDDGDEVPAYALRYASGYVHTLEDVRRAYPDGVDGRHAVWLWRRLLEVLGFVHRSGRAHGAVLPGHVLVHAKDHGARLVGWSRSTPLDDEAVARDLARAARTVRWTAARDLPGNLAALLDDVAGRGHEDAWALSERVAAEARTAYGPPRFHPFTMPGWTQTPE